MRAVCRGILNDVHLTRLLTVSAMITVEVPVESSRCWNMDSSSLGLCLGSVLGVLGRVEGESSTVLITILGGFLGRLMGPILAWVSNPPDVACSCWIS